MNGLRIAAVAQQLLNPTTSKKHRSMFSFHEVTLHDTCTGCKTETDTHIQTKQHS
eukprot:m.453812 g.453812  ORF g.453812 m.453812 type:complete len:55 (+) comp21556_c0_seq3:1494-1658(+)